MRREASCVCCRRNDAPEGERNCTSCSRHHSELLSDPLVVAALALVEALKLSAREEWSEYHEYRKRTDPPPWGLGLDETEEQS